MQYVPISDRSILSLSTDDGRILFYSTQELVPETRALKEREEKGTRLPSCRLVGQLGGVAAGFSRRIKDYTILALPEDEGESESRPTLFVVTGGSDGVVRLWAVEKEEFLEVPEATGGAAELGNDIAAEIPQVGRLLGAYETGNRITCLKSFVLTGQPDDGGEAANVRNGAHQSDDENSGSDSDDSEWSTQYGRSLPFRESVKSSVNSSVEDVRIAIVRIGTYVM
jgi:protein MAK11